MLQAWLQRLTSVIGVPNDKWNDRAAPKHPSRRNLGLQPLEQRDLLAHIAPPQVALPSKIGEEFVVDDWDNDVTATQFGLNYFSGNNGNLANTQRALSNQSSSGTGHSLSVTQTPGDGFGGFFTILFGRNQVDVTLDPSQTAAPVDVPGLFLDALDIYRGFGPLAGRSIDQLRFDINHAMPADLKIRIELKDEAATVVSTNITVANTQGLWTPVVVAVPGAFTGGNPGGFNWRQVNELVFVLEANDNPTGWTFLADNLRLVDVDGMYPDLNAAASPTDGTLLPQYTEAFLDHVRLTSSLYFADFSSRFPSTGGLIQDNSTFPDLMTVGGTGFQLTSYVIDAQRGYLSRPDAAQRVLGILRTLDQQPQGSAPVGTIGNEGFFYHFLGTNGLRKQNPGGNPTVELSLIDTALAMAGVVTSGQFFTAATPEETEIRARVDAIYRRVNWSFLLNDLPGPRQNQFFLAWKPEDTDPDFQFAKPGVPGRFTGKPGDPQTIDFYTDEGLLAALLAMGSPNAANRMERRVWDAMIREDDGGEFIKTFPGSLFTYQFASVWLDTADLGMDTHPTRPVNFFENTRSAIEATRNYALANATNPPRATWLNGAGATRWGLSAAEGPLGSYFAEAARPAALTINNNDPLDVGTVTAYGVGSSVVHVPELAIAALWATAREDLNLDGRPELLHPRVGFADAFNLDVADATLRGAFDPGSVVRTPNNPPHGPWANFSGFAIDHGPMLALIDNYLNHNFVPRLFMSSPQIRSALDVLFGTIVTGAGAGGGPHVRVFNAAADAERFGLFAYAPNFAGGVRVATGDVNGDGVLDVITAPGPGGGPHVKVFDGVDGHLLRQFFAYGEGFTGGVFVASGDVNADGRDDIITGAGAGGGPHVRAFSGMNGAELLGFYAYDPNFGGGVSVAVADVNGVGPAEIVTGAGAGGGPHVRVFSGETGAQLPEGIGSFFAYAAGFTGGVFVAAGDVNGDGHADVYTGAGAGGGPHVRVFSGENRTELHSFFAYNPLFGGGVRVAAADLDADGRDDIITGAGPGGGPHVRGFSGVNRAELTGFFAYDAAFAGGVFVAGSPGGAAVGSLRLADETGAVEMLSRERMDAFLAAAIGRWDEPSGLVGENSLLEENADFLMRSMRTTLAPAAMGRVDRLSVALHELEHEDGSEAANDLRLPTLELGVRQLPWLPLVDAALAGWE